MQDKCAFYKECGGCCYQGTEYSRQLSIKQKRVEELLKDYAKVLPIIGAKEPEYYRNKVHGVFGHDKKGNVFTGIYQEGTHKIIPVVQCRIEDKRAAAIMQTIAELVKAFKYKVYDEDAHSGLMRHVLIRVGKKTGQIMVVLVITSPVLPSKNNFVKELVKLHPEINTIVLNVNDKNTTMVLGDKNITAYGTGYIEDELCGLRFKISPSSFYQINPPQTEILYNKAIEFAKFSGNENIIDAYCGIGTIGMTAASRVKRVTGVELNKAAIKDAISNAKQNNISNVRFVAEDASKYMTALARTGEKVDAVIMDPPRSGSTKEFVDAVSRLAAEKIIYISCNPESLARDLLWFKQKNYKVKLIQPVDMFPFTSHIETIVLMSRTKGNRRENP